MTNGQNTNNGNVMSEIGSSYTPPSASSQPNSYTPKANPSVIDNWKKSAQDIVNNKQTQADIKEFFGDAIEWVSPLLQAMGLGWIQNMFNTKSEQRANEEYDRRVADERAYNDPRAVAQRYALAGINPLSVMTNGGPITSSTTSAPTPTSNNLGGLSGLSNLLQVGSRVNLNDAQTIAALGAESRNVQRFPIELYGLELANALNKFNYDEAVKQAPYILAKLEGDVEYQEQALENLRKQGDLTDVEIKEHEENILNLQSTRGLIKAQELLALSGIQLNESQRNLFIAQTATEKERTGLVESQKRYSRMECKELYEVLKSRLDSGYYKTITKSETNRLSYELEKTARTLWEKPEDTSNWWYFGNLLWNIQNCLTLSGSGSVSSSSGSRVVTKK